MTVTSAGSGTRVTLQRVDVGEDLKWTDPEWLADTHDWIIESLDRLGLTLMGPIEQPRVRPWATLLRAPGSEGTVWCKGMVDAVAHEPVAISILARAAPDRVPRLLAADRARRLMLTADGGTRLRDLEAPQAKPEAVDGDAARLRPPPAGGRGRGRTSWWAPACPTGGSRSFRARSPSSSRSSSRRELDGLVPRLAEACAELAALGIPETIEHSDLHDAQVFAAPDGDRFFDWGDASVAHPFLSLTVSLRVLASTVGVADDSPTVDTAIDAYLERWSALAPLADLRRGAALGRALGGASRALTWHAIAVAAPATQRMFPNVAAEWLEDTAQALA